VEKRTIMTNIFRFSFASSNPAVFTDGYCYLDWIAEQYNMKVRWIYVHCSGSPTLLPEIYGNAATAGPPSESGICLIFTPVTTGKFR
jgi:hypothetical protein